MISTHIRIIIITHCILMRDLRKKASRRRQVWQVKNKSSSTSYIKFYYSLCTYVDYRSSKTLYSLKIFCVFCLFGISSIYTSIIRESSWRDDVCREWENKSHKQAQNTKIHNENEREAGQAFCLLFELWQLNSSNISFHSIFKQTEKQYQNKIIYIFLLLMLF